MANFLLKSPDCVFIHIPKTAGTSIRKGIWRKNYETPVFGYVPPAWHGYFKFAFVRHPLDRFISAWKMFTQGPIGDTEWCMAPDARPLSLEEFADIVLDDGIVYDERRSTFEERIRHHTIPQTHPFNCLHLADFVGRFETLEQDFADVRRRLRVGVPFPRMHYTEHGPWDEYLDLPLVARLEQFYRDDFRTLGYASVTLGTAPMSKNPVAM